METLEAIRTQRVIRRFRPETVPEEVLRRILDAGRRAGSSKNLQRWAFIVVRDRGTLESLAKVGPYAAHLAGAAVGVGLVTPRPDGNDGPYSVMWDLGRAAQNMTLAAWDLGVGSVPATVYEQDLCRQILGYPEDQHCEYLLSFGWPLSEEDRSRPPKAGGRLELDEILHPEHW
jgi:nitroreductase